MAYTGESIKDLDITTPLETEVGNVLNDAQWETKKVLKNQFAVVAKVGAYTLTASDSIVNCNGTFTITLPTPSTVASAAFYKEYLIKSIVGGGTVTLGGTVDGTVNPTITAGNSMHVYTDGTSWFEITVASLRTGTGSTFAMSVSPTFTTPNLGIPASGVLTNCTGTAAGLTAGNATTAGNADTVDTYHASQLAKLGEPNSFTAIQGMAKDNQTTPETAVLQVSTTSALTGDVYLSLIAQGTSIAALKHTRGGSGFSILDGSNNLANLAIATLSGVLTNCTGLPVSSGISGFGIGIATWLGTPSSANLAAAVTDETGTGALVFATSPTLVTPALGTPASGVLTNCTGTAAGLTAGNATNATNATTAGGFTPSQAPGANNIVVLDAGGVMAAGTVPLARMIRAGGNGEMQGSGTTTATLDLGTVVAGDRIHLTGDVVIGTANSPIFTKSAGTATVDFAGATRLIGGYDTTLAAGGIGGVCRVTSGGTLTLQLGATGGTPTACKAHAIVLNNG